MNSKYFQHEIWKVIVNILTANKKLRHKPHDVIIFKVNFLPFLLLKVLDKKLCVVSKYNRTEWELSSKFLIYGQAFI